MAGFIRRSTTIPSIEVIQQIEGVFVIDLAPPDPATGTGSGTVLLVGEFEDGEFATDDDVIGAVEVFGSEDFRQKFGGFGYSYQGVVAQNPSARRHLGELWNGNGYLKAYKLRAQRLLIARVDTSVGSVSFDPTACQVAGALAPYVLAVGDTLDVETDVGTGSSTAIAAAVATVAGAGEAFASIVSGDTFGIRVDGGPETQVVFGAADTTVAAVVARINSTLGYAAASDNAGEVDLVGIVPGLDGDITLVDTVTGTLAKLGHVAGSTAGTGNVGNLNAVSATELVEIINATVALDTLGVKADLDPAGQLRVCNTSTASTAELRIDPAELGTKLGFPLASLTDSVTPADHPGGLIAAGTRVRDSGSPDVEWVVMQTLEVPAGALGPFVAKVRPAFDDGNAAGLSAGLIDTLVDPSNIGALAVSNAAALTAALDENQLDNRYLTALERTLDERGVAREANYLLSARRSDAVVRGGVANAVKASECGLFGRKFISGDPLGATIADAIVNVAKFRSDRLFYTSKGLRVRIPEIAEVGAAGGLGFVDGGIITVRPDGPLTTINAILNPEENPGQQTGLIDDFFQVDTFGETLDIEAYKAYRREGICVPRNDRQSGMIFQSGVTSSLASGRTTQARRKMADFIQDSLAELLNPFVKRLNTQARRNRLRGLVEEFLATLQSENTPENARIEAFSVDDSVNAGNTPAVLARGIFYLQVRVRTLSSLDDIVLQTEIGPNAIITTQAA